MKEFHGKTPPLAIFAPIHFPEWQQTGLMWLNSLKWLIVTVRTVRNDMYVMGAGD
jgi:hypothetical protein